MTIFTDNMQNVLADLSRGRTTVKTCLHCDPSPIKKNVSQIKKKSLKRASPVKKVKSLTWRSGLGLPVTSVADMDSVNQKLNTNDYLTEFVRVFCIQRFTVLFRNLFSIHFPSLENIITALQCQRNRFK